MLSLTLSWQPCSLSQRIRHSSRLEAFHDPPFPGKTEPSFSSCHSTPAPAAETTHCPQRCPNDVAAESYPGRGCPSGNHFSVPNLVLNTAMTRFRSYASHKVCHFWGPREGGCGLLPSLLFSTGYDIWTQR